MKYLYRAVDRLGHTVDFLLTAQRDVAAARRFFEWAVGLHDVPEKITIDKSGANTAAVNGLIDDSGASVEVLKQSHQAGPPCDQAANRPMLGVKSLCSAAKLIAGVETMHMIRKGQMACPEGQAMSAADQFYSLAF